jgi:hypothetical protein
LAAGGKLRARGETSNISDLVLRKRTAVASPMATVREVDNRLAITSAFAAV